MARALLRSHDVRAETCRILKAGTCSIASSALDVVMLIVLVELVSARVGPAAFVSAGLGAVCNFLVTRHWVFGLRAPIDARQVAAYAAVAAGTALLVAAAIQILVSGMGVAYLAAKLVASIGVFALWSYPAQARWVFAKGERYAH